MSISKSSSHGMNFLFRWAPSNVPFSTIHFNSGIFGKTLSRSVVASVRRFLPHFSIPASMFLKLFDDDIVAFGQVLRDDC